MDNGTDTGSLMVEGGTEMVYGTASGDDVYGVQIVTGDVSGETIYYGGEVEVVSGGTASDMTVQIGGQLQLAGTATDITLENGTVALASTECGADRHAGFPGWHAGAAEHSRQRRRRDGADHGFQRQ